MIIRTSTLLSAASLIVALRLRTWCSAEFATKEEAIATGFPPTLFAKITDWLVSAANRCRRRIHPRMPGSSALR